MSTSCGTVRLVPGPQGPSGTNGTNGADGVSAFTLTIDDFTMPASSATVTVDVADESWMAVGEPVYVQGAGTLQVTALAAQQATLENLGYSENITPGTIIASGAQVTPSGWKGEQGTPGSTTGVLLAVNDLSDVDDAATARANLGLGTMAVETAANYLTKAGNLAGLANTVTARTNLGLGSAAVAAATAFLSSSANLAEIAALGAGAQSTARSNLGILGGILAAALVQQVATTALTAGVNTRALTSEAFDPSGIVTLSGGNFTLQSGSYLILAFAAGYACDLHQLTLFDGSIEVAVGSTTNASTTGTVGIESTAMLVTRVTPGAATTYTLRHYCQTTKTINGQGLDAAAILSTPSNVFAQVLILQQA